jgi:Integrase core domain
LVVERLIGTVRRECLDRVLILGEAHLRQILSSYAAYYNEVRTHLALGKDAPAGQVVQRPAPLSLSQFCPGCTTITSGYNFRKGQPAGNPAALAKSKTYQLLPIWAVARLRVVRT